jgi:hypothetical protein
MKFKSDGQGKPLGLPARKGRGTDFFPFGRIWCYVKPFILRPTDVRQKTLLGAGMGKASGAVIG